MLLYHCKSLESFFDAMADLEQTKEFQKLTDRQRDVVCSLIGEWYETAFDDLVYRIYGFPMDSAYEPHEYLADAKKRGVYRELSYQYSMCYPDIGELTAVFIF